MKKLLAWLLAVCMIISVMPISVFAATETTTEPADFTITTAAELQSFAAAVTAGDNYAGKIVRLGADIDLTDVAWTPIGGWDGSVQFLGEFDGNGKTIKNLTIDSTNVTASKYRGGLFSNLGEGSSVHDLSFKAVKITAANAGQYGALAGRSGASLKNITVDTVTATSVAGAYIGGAVGITNYYESGTYGFAWDNVDAKDVKIDFTTTESNSYGGGLLGGMNPNGARLNTYENCDVTNVTITSAGDGWHGGMWGWHGRSGAFNYVKKCSVTNVNITSNSTTNASENRIGGICGFVGVSGGLFENVTVNGGTLTANDGHAGGFAPWSYAWGQDTYKDCSVTNVNVTCTNGVAAGFVAASGAGNQTTKCIDCEVVGGTVTGRIASGFAGIDRVGNAGGAYVLDGCTSSATVSGSELAAGIIARANSSYATVVSDFDFTGEVSGEGTVTKGIITTVANNELIAANGVEIVTKTDAEKTEDAADSVAVVNGKRFATLAAAVAAANAAVDADGNAVATTVTLIADVKLGEKLTISGNVTISGTNTITRDAAYTGTLFAVNAGASLTLDGGLVIDGANNYQFDSQLYNEDLADWETSIPKADNAKWFTPETDAPVADAYMITTSGTVNLNNVSVKNHYSTNGSGIVSASKGAVVNLTGAQITHNASTSGSGLVVNASAGVWSREEELITVTMNEGTVIDGNHVGGNHGIFKIYQGTYFTMNGGEIKNTTGWNSNGTAIGIYHAVFTMNGGTICSNSSVYGPNNGRNGAIYGHSNHLFTMNDGTICHNTGRSKAGIDSPYSETGYSGLTVINGGTVVDNTVLGTWTNPDVNGGATLTINGGTFTQDVTNWLAADTGLVYDEATGKYTVTDSVWEMHLTDANGEAHWLSPMYGDDLSQILEHSKVWYDSLQGTYDFTLKLVANTKVDATAVVDFPLTIDLNGNKVVAASSVSSSPVFRILSDVTVKGGTVDGRGGESCYAFIVGNSATAGNLTIESGNYYGDTTVASVTQGTLNVNGGTFEATVYNDAYEFTLNCIDANYKNNTANIVVKGGSFYGFDPANNAAEGTGTNFVADGYISQQEADYYTVLTEEDIVAQNTTTGKKYVDLNKALTECADGETVELLKDVDLGGATWTPIASFGGNFVGNNHTVSNFHIDATNARGGFFNVIEGSNGLEDVKVKDLVLSDVTATVGNNRFGTLANSIQGVVHNVTVKNINVTTTHKDAWVGGMAAFMSWPWMTNCTVENLTVDATAGAEFVSGFACILQKNSNHVFDNLDVNGFKVIANDTDDSCAVSGFVGQTQRGWENPKIINSDVTGIDITATGTVDAAGFIAWPGAHTIAENCTTEGKIDVTGVTSADCFAGGFFGNLGWNADLGKMGHVVTGCTADVDIKTSVAPAGGFVGSATNSNNYSMYATFTDCTAKGDITCAPGGTADVGGFAGDADRGVYTNCKATGTVTGTDYAGGFIGHITYVKPAYDYRYPAGTRDYLAHQITIENCTGAPAVTGAEGKTAGMVGYIEANTDVTLKGNTYTVEPEYYPIGNATEIFATITFNENGNDEILVIGTKDDPANGYFTSIQAAIGTNSYSDLANMGYWFLAHAGTDNKGVDATPVSNVVLTLYSDINEAVKFPSNYFMVAADYDITVDLNGYKWTSDAGKTIETFVNTTIKNGTVDNTAAYGRAVDMRGDIDLVVDNATLSAGKTNAQALTVGGDVGAGNRAGVEIKNGSTVTAMNGYSVIVYNPVDMTITDSAITGWNALYFKAASGSQGSAGSIVNATNSQFNSLNIKNGEQNNFATIVFEDSNVTVNVNGGQISAVSGVIGGTSEQYLIGFNSDGLTGNTVKTTADTEIYLANYVVANFDDANTVTLPADCTNAIEAQGYVAADNGDGTVTIEYKKPYVVFDFNGGTNTYGSATEEATVSYGYQFLLRHPLDCGTPIREGYACTGFTTEQNGGGTKYEFGTTITFTEDITLYAQWKFVEAYIDVNGDGKLNPAELTDELTFDKVEDAIAAAKAGDIVALYTNAEIEGTATLTIDKAITLDLGDKTLTTNGTFGGLILKGGCSIKNGTINHKGTVTAIKAWDVASIEDVTIDVAFKAEGKTIGGIVIQQNAAGIDTLKNVTIKGEGLTNGIETYNCGNATEPVIGSMENVTIDAKGTGLLLSAPCGTATNCNIKGGVSGIELWIKGTYSATLNLSGCTVEGGEQAIFAHDEFNSNPAIENKGTLKLTMDEATTLKNENGAILNLVIARAENVDVRNVTDRAEALVGDAKDGVYYDTLQNALNACTEGETVTLLKDISIADYDDVKALKLPSNGNGKYNEEHGNGAIYHVITPGVTLDLNGKSITWDAHSDDYCNARQVSLFMVTVTGNAGETADLTIKDSVGTAKVDVYGMGTAVYTVGVGATSTIEGGTWTNYPCKTCGASNIFIYPSHGGKLYITGGTFEQKESEYLLGWCGSSKPTTNNGVGTDYDETLVSITGGTYVDFDPEDVKFFDVANSGQETINGVADGYYSVESSTDVWTISEAVAVNVQTGKMYNDLSDALEEAVSGQTVQMLKDYTEGYVLVTPGVTLNLNGKTVTASYVVGFNGSNVIDSEKATKTGRIKVAKDNMVLDLNNEYMPIYDAENGAYAFVKFRYNSKGDGTGTDRFGYNDANNPDTYYSSPVFGESSAARNLAYDLLVDGYESTGVKVVIRVRWSKDGVYDAKQDFAFTDETVAEVVNSMNTDEKQEFYATFFGEDLSNGDAIVSTVIISDTGIELESGSVPIVISEDAQ